MSGFKIDIGNGQRMNITQGIGDITAGINMGNDLSRISAYQGSDIGCHTGINSPTLSRHGNSFGSESNLAYFFNAMDNGGYK